MLKRTLAFSSPYFLRLENAQFVYESKEAGKESGHCPLEDLGFIVIDHPQVLMTQPLITALTENNTAVIFCDGTHLPRGMILNLCGHTLQNELFRIQAEATLPLKKRLWKGTIEQKIKNQAAFLKKIGAKFRDVENLAERVKSGDSDNREGVAARLYWQRLFPDEDFIREREGGGANPLLNYGYAILRGAVARALSGSGLLATLGIHHHNRYNPFALADDIMEPFRPYVDEIVHECRKNVQMEGICDPAVKRTLLQLLTTDIHYPACKRPLMVGLSITTASLARCFSGEEKNITYPLLR